jgi:hypothetical protein
MHGAKHDDDFYLLGPKYRNGRGTEYIRDDLHRAEVDALVAAAYEDAATTYEDGFPAWDVFGGATRAIRALTPDDARAALRAHTEAAVRRALEGASAEAAGEVAAHGESHLAPFVRRRISSLADNPAQFIGDQK